MTILLLCRDLVFPSRVKAVAEREGMTLETLRNPQQLVSRLETSDAQLVLIDLTCPGLNPEELTAAAGNVDPRPQLIGFGPHVKQALLESARDAGFDQVLTNGQFDSQMTEVIRG